MPVVIATTLGCAGASGKSLRPGAAPTYGSATLPPASTASTTESEDPEPPRREPVLLDNTSLAVQQATDEYVLGEEAFRSGDLDGARRHFDAAILALMSSGLSVNGDPRLREAFDRISQDVQSLEWEALTASEQGDADREESPVDELKDITMFLTPEELALEMEKIRPPSESDKFSIPVLINDRVLTFIEAFQGHFRKAFAGGYERMGRYEEMIRQTLREEGLPEDLIYLAFIESTFKPTAYSRARAKGIWQFMASTGARYGLVRNAYVDERSDPEKSTRAAARYLKDLYAMFGDWYLVMAAYNAGEGLVIRAIERTGKKDFWDLARTRYLRTETKNFVPSILALSIMSRDPERYGFGDLRKDPSLEFDRVTLEGATDLGLLARLAGTTVERIRELNPQLRRSMTPPGYRAYQVRVPRGAGESFRAAYAALPASEKIAPVRATYRVRRGDTLSRIARRFGTSVSALAEANGISTDAKLATGISLLVPGGLDGSQSGGRGAYRDRGGSALAGPDGRYVVRRGDTLSHIARRHRTTVQKIASLSGISERSILMPGQILIVRESAAPVPRKTSPTTTARASGPAGPQQRVAYKVRPGDNLYRIARRYGTTVRSIQSWNGLERTTTIYPGDVLTIYIN